ncbi:hypothetical protein ACHAWF_010909, partial [Thalassiosira exigua]
MCEPGNNLTTLTDTAAIARDFYYFSQFGYATAPVSMGDGGNEKNRRFAAALCNISGADGEVTKEEHDFIVGYCAAKGYPAGILDDIPKMCKDAETKSIEDVIAETRELMKMGSLKSASRQIVYDAIRAAGADGLDDKEKVAIATVAKELGVSTEELDKIYALVEKEEELKAERIATLYPAGHPCLAKEGRRASFKFQNATTPPAPLDSHGDRSRGSTLTVPTQKTLSDLQNRQDAFSMSSSIALSNRRCACPPDGPDQRIRYIPDRRSPNRWNEIRGLPPAPLGHVHRGILAQLVDQGSGANAGQVLRPCDPLDAIVRPPRASSDGIRRTGPGAAGSCVRSRTERFSACAKLVRPAPADRPTSPYDSLSPGATSRTMPLGPRVPVVDRSEAVRRAPFRPRRERASNVVRAAFGTSSHPRGPEVVSSKGAAAQRDGDALELPRAAVAEERSRRAEVGLLDGVHVGSGRCPPPPRRSPLPLPHPRRGPAPIAARVLEELAPDGPSPRRRTRKSREIGPGSSVRATSEDRRPCPGDASSFEGSSPTPASISSFRPLPPPPAAEPTHPQHPRRSRSERELPPHEGSYGPISRPRVLANFRPAGSAAKPVHRRVSLLPFGCEDVVRRRSFPGELSAPANRKSLDGRFFARCFPNGSGGTTRRRQRRPCVSNETHRTPARDAVAARARRNGGRSSGPGPDGANGASSSSQTAQLGYTPPPPPFRTWDARSRASDEDDVRRGELRPRERSEAVSVRQYGASASGRRVDSLPSSSSARSLTNEAGIGEI